MKRACKRKGVSTTVQKNKVRKNDAQTMVCGHSARPPVSAGGCCNGSRVRINIVENPVPDTLERRGPGRRPSRGHRAGPARSLPRTPHRAVETCRPASDSINLVVLDKGIDTGTAVGRMFDHPLSQLSVGGPPVEAVDLHPPAQLHEFLMAIAEDLADVLVGVSHEELRQLDDTQRRVPLALLQEGPRPAAAGRRGRPAATGENRVTPSRRDRQDRFHPYGVEIHVKPAAGSIRAEERSERQGERLIEWPRSVRIPSMPEPPPGLCSPVTPRRSPRRATSRDDPGAARCTLQLRQASHPGSE